jgi:hypothetical protein
MGHGVYTRCGGIARLSRTEVSRLRGTTGLEQGLSRADTLGIGIAGGVGGDGVGRRKARA